MRYIVKDLYGYRYAVVDRESKEKKDEQICICRKKINAMKVAFSMNTLMTKGEWNEEKENKCNSKKD